MILKVKWMHPSNHDFESIPEEEIMVVVTKLIEAKGSVLVLVADRGPDSIRKIGEKLPY